MVTIARGGLHRNNDHNIEMQQPGSPHSLAEFDDDNLPYKTQHLPHTGLGDIYQTYIQPEFGDMFRAQTETRPFLNDLEPLTVPLNYWETALTSSADHVNNCSLCCSVAGPLWIVIAAALIAISVIFKLGPGLYVVAALGFALFILPYCCCFGFCAYPLCFCFGRPNNIRTCGLPNCYEKCLDNDFFSRSDLLTEQSTYPQLHESLNRLSQNVPVLIFNVRAWTEDIGQTTLFEQSFQLPYAFSRYQGYSIKHFTLYLTNRAPGHVAIQYIPDLIIHPSDNHIILRFQQILYETYKHKGPHLEITFQYFTVPADPNSVWPLKRQSIPFSPSKFVTSFPCLDLTVYKAISDEIRPPVIDPDQRNNPHAYAERFHVYRNIDLITIPTNLNVFHTQTSQQYHVDFFAPDNAPNASCRLHCCTSMPCWVLSFFCGTLCCVINTWKKKYSWIFFKPKYHISFASWECIERMWIQNLQDHPENQLPEHPQADGARNPFFATGEKTTPPPTSVESNLLWD